MTKYLILVLSLLLMGCAAAPTPTPAPTATATLSVTVTPVIGDTTPAVPVATSSVPFDALFIDTMTVLHENATELAQAALSVGEHEELRTYAQQVVDTNGTETQQMSDWRTQWYADLGTSTMLLTNVTEVQIVNDGGLPFDMRFINAMIEHHRVAIAIAQLGQTQAEHPELRTFAEQIVTTYTTAISQLEEWRQTWYEISG